MTDPELLFKKHLEVLSEMRKAILMMGLAGFLLGLGLGGFATNQFLRWQVIDPQFNMIKELTTGNRGAIPLKPADAGEDV